MLTVLRDLTGQYMSEHQRKVTNLSVAPVMHFPPLCFMDFVYELAFHRFRPSYLP